MCSLLLKDVTFTLYGEGCGDVEDFKLRFYTNFIKDDRYMYLVTGLGNTLAITFLAVLLGIVLGFLVAIIRSTYDKTGRGKIPNFLCAECI